MDRLLERLAMARKALGTLQELAPIAQPTTVERDAAIQRFEYTFETTWKAAQRYLLVQEGLEVGSPKAAIRSARDVGLLDDTQTRLGLEMTDDRNLAVHTYNEALSGAIFAKLSTYANLCQWWLGEMTQRVERDADYRASLENPTVM